jgi:F0F1-type ATP synthase membrane subunit b/b'
MSSSAASVKDLILPAIHVAVLFYFIFKFAKQPFLAFVGDRHTKLRVELQNTAQKLRAAKESLEEYSAKLGAIEAEVGALRDQAREEGRSTQVRILTEAKRMADLVVSDARLAAKDQALTLRRELVDEAATKLVQKVEEKLSVFSKSGNVGEQTKAFVTQVKESKA